MTFAELIAGAAPRESGFALTIPETWHQGRTAYGGFSTALALVAAMEVGGEGLPPLRSASVSFIGPLFGAVEVTAQVERRGRNATWISARVTREGETGLVASFVFMGPVASELRLEQRPAPEGTIPPGEARAAVHGKHAPAFLGNHIEVRYARPRGEVKQPRFDWWVRLRDRSGIDPMVELMLIADCSPPGVVPLLSGRVAASSMIWQANVLSAAPTTRDGWWQICARSDYAEHGCANQYEAVWNADGEPMVAAIQSIAVFG